MGALVTDFTLIKAGALHRANGGYLMLDARKVLIAALRLGRPEAGAALARDPHRVARPGAQPGQHRVAGAGADPARRQDRAGRRAAALLPAVRSTTPTSPSCSRSTADFDERDRPRRRERAALRALDRARWRGSERLRPFDRAAVARIIEHSARMAEDSRQAVVAPGQPVRPDARGGLLGRGDDGHRADRGAPTSSRPSTRQVHRADRVRERMQEADPARHGADRHRGRAASGQINGLSVIAAGRLRLRQAERASRRRVRLGKGEVIDIEREVELGGPIHSKGVLILSGFLAHALRRRTAALAVGEPGVRAVLRRRRGRQRLAGRAVRAAVGARARRRSGSRWP